MKTSIQGLVTAMFLSAMLAARTSHGGMLDGIHPAGQAVDNGARAEETPKAPAETRKLAPDPAAEAETEAEKKLDEARNKMTGPVNKAKDPGPKVNRQVSSQPE